MMRRVIVAVVVIELIAIVAAVLWAQNTAVLLNTQYNAESTGNVLTVPERVWFPGAYCDAGVTGYVASPWSYPASPNNLGANCIAGSNVLTATLDFVDDGTNTRIAMMPMKLPSDWSGTIDAKMVWRTSATTGNVVWQIATACVADAETTDPSLNTANTVTDAAKGTTLQLNDASITGITTTGCAAGELLYLKLFRNPAHASDTIGATAELFGMELTYRRAM